MGVLSGETNWGGVGNGVEEEDLCQDLSPGMAAMWGLTKWFWGSFNHTAQEAGKQDIAAMQSSLLEAWKNAGETLWEGNG